MDRILSAFLTRQTEDAAALNGMAELRELKSVKKRRGSLRRRLVKLLRDGGTDVASLKTVVSEMRHVEPDNRFATVVLQWLEDRR